MPRLLPAMLAVSIAALAVLYHLLTPARTAAEPVPALTPTRPPTVVSYLPAIFKPLPATATPTLAPSPTTTPTVGVAPTATPTLPPPTYNNCQDDPNPSAAPNYPIAIVNINKVTETVTVRNMTTGDTIDLTGWKMCSITGNHHHPLDGSSPLGPGSTLSFTNGGGPIWNNTNRDDGALYDPQGRLVSYWFD